MSRRPSPSAFPNYLEARRVVPIGVWRALSACSVAAASTLVALMFVDPSLGLKLWWSYLLPVLPAVWLFAPGLWRNVCPMAMINQLPRLFGWSRERSVPDWLRRRAYSIQVVFYLALVLLRVPLLDSTGAATGTVFLLALVAPFAGGLAFKGKSGWCGSFCPLMPVQKLYGQSPLVVVPNMHCQPCQGCSKNCYDFNPRVALLADLHDEDEVWAAQRSVFAGAFPGFVIAFFSLHKGLPPVEFAALTLAAALASLGVFVLVDQLSGLATATLVELFGACGFVAYYLLALPGAFDVSKPPWLLACLDALAVAAAASFLVRSWRKDRVLLFAGADDELAEAALQVRPGAGMAGAQDRLAEATVEFSAGPTVMRRLGAPLLEIAERAGVRIEAGCRMGVCGADPIAVLSGAEHLSAVTPAERQTLERLGLGESCRMACCAKVNGPVTVSTSTKDAPAGAAPLRPAPRAHDASVRRIVIVGNGIAGVTAADHARRSHPGCAIDLVAEERYPLYNRMGLSSLIYGRSAMSRLHLLPDSWYADRDITCWLNTQAHQLDTAAREVLLGTGERLGFDRLVLATGSSAIVPPAPGIESAFVVRTADDATSLRAFAQRQKCRRAVVVGGGLLGLEAAYALHQLGLRTVVLDRSARLLHRVLDERSSELLGRYLQALPIDVATGAVLEAVDGAAHLVRLVDGSELPADLVVVCAGVRPNTALAERAGLGVGRGILVDDSMRTSDPQVLAAGDCSEHEGVVPGLWPIAVEQGEVAGTNAAGGVATWRPAPQLAVLKGVGLSVKSAGALEESPGDEVETSDPGGDEIRYRKVIRRHGLAVGAIYVGDWDDTDEVLDTVRLAARGDEPVPA